MKVSSYKSTFIHIFIVGELVIILTRYFLLFAVFCYSHVVLNNHE